MFRIDDASNAASIPTPDAAGTFGFFKKPIVGGDGTIVTHDWANTIQEEITGVVLDAGLTLSKTNNAQLLQAIKVISINTLPASISGLQLSNDTDADHDISISVGKASSSADSPMSLATALVKQIDAAWAVGNNAGGLFTGTVAADTWYHVFLIEKDSDSSIDAGFDTSFTASNIPTGYTNFRRIGSVLTNATSNIIGFKQDFDIFTWKDPAADYDAAASTAGQLITLSTPPGLSTMVWLHYSVNGVGVAILINPASTSFVPTGTDGKSLNQNSGVNHVTLSTTNASSQIHQRSSSTSNIKLFTVAYRDVRP